MSGTEEAGQESSASSSQHAGDGTGKVAGSEISIFRPMTKHITVRDVQLPDSFFEPTAKELSNAMRNFSNNTQNMLNATMKTKKMREAEAQRRMSRFPKVLIRILFPDRVAIQGIFTPQTTLLQVTEFVRRALRDEDKVNFYLFVVPPKRKLSDMRSTLWKEGLVPAAIVHLGVDGAITNSSELIKPELLAKMEDAPEAKSQQQEATTDSGAPADVTQHDKADAEEDAAKKSAKSEAKLKKVPKWFKK